MLRSEGGIVVPSATAKAKPVAWPLKIRVLSENHDADLLERSRLERREHVLGSGVNLLPGTLRSDVPLQVRPIGLPWTEMVGLRAVRGQAGGVSAFM